LVDEIDSRKKEKTKTEILIPNLKIENNASK